MRTRAAVLIAAVCTAGCYSYLPVTTPHPEAGTSVAVTLTDAGTLELGRYLGFDAFIVRGRYVSADEHGLVVSVTTVETRRGDWAPWAGETVTLPMAAVASLQLRQFDKGRTILLAGVGVAGLAASAATFALIGGATAGGASGPPPIKR